MVHGKWKCAHTYKWNITCFACHVKKEIGDADFSEPKELPKGWMVFRHPNREETAGAGYPMCEKCYTRLANLLEIDP